MLFWRFMSFYVFLFWPFFVTFNTWQNFDMSKIAIIDVILTLYVILRLFVLTVFRHFRNVAKFRHVENRLICRKSNVLLTKDHQKSPNIILRDFMIKSFLTQRPPSSVKKNIWPLTPQVKTYLTRLFKEYKKVAKVFWRFRYVLDFY
jgi:hypothetical protein